MGERGVMEGRYHVRAGSDGRERSTHESPTVHNVHMHKTIAYTLASSHAAGHTQVP